jgi:hypothetical protein
VLVYVQVCCFIFLLKDNFHQQAIKQTERFFPIFNLDFSLPILGEWIIVKNSGCVVSVDSMVMNGKL